MASYGASARAATVEESVERTLGVSVDEARETLKRIAPTIGESVGLGSEDELRLGATRVAMIGSKAGVEVALRGEGMMARVRCSVTLTDEETEGRLRARASDAAWATCERVFVATQSTPVRGAAYSGQIVLADALAGPGALFVAPVVHLVHHRPKQAAFSFALRLGAMGAGAAIGAAIAMAAPMGTIAEGAPCRAPCVASPNYLPGLVAYIPLGIGVGWLSAAVVDAVVLARPSVRATIQPTLGGLLVHGTF